MDKRVRNKSMVPDAHADRYYPEKSTGNFHHPL